MTQNRHRKLWRMLQSIPVVLLVCLSCAGQTANVSTRQAQCKEFVQSFYDWYLSPVAKDKRHPDGTRDIDDVLAKRPASFAIELLQLLRNDRHAQIHAGEIVGLDFDPFVNSQDPSPLFRVQSVQLTDDGCTAIVWGMQDEHHRETVMPVLKEENQKWKFVNFQYPDEKGDAIPDLIALLNLLKKDRAANKPR